MRYFLKIHKIFLSLIVLLLALSVPKKAQALLFSVGSTQKFSPEFGDIAGALCVVNPITGEVTFVGDPTSNLQVGLSGAAFDSGGRLFASTVSGPTQVNFELIEIDMQTGGLVQTIGAIRTTDGTPLKLSDLAMQPGTNVLFGVSATFGAGSRPTAEIYTIDKNTGIATLVFDTSRVFGGGVAFSSDGTLFQTSFLTDILEPREDRTPGLIAYNAATGQVISEVALSEPFYSFDALDIRNDGTIFAAGSFEDIDNNVIANDLFVTIDPNTGFVNVIANTGDRPGDLAFMPSVPEPSSMLSLLALGTLGAGSALLRKKDNHKSALRKNGQQTI